VLPSRAQDPNRNGEQQTQEAGSKEGNTERYKAHQHIFFATFYIIRYAHIHITASTLFDYATNETFTILIRPTIAMFTDLYQLIGGMTVTVLAILCPVVTRTFSLSDPDETLESGSIRAAKKSKRQKSKKNIRPPILPTRTAPNTPAFRTPSPSPPAPPLPPRHPALLPASSSSADPQRESASGTPSPTGVCSSGSDTAVEDLPDAPNRTEPADSELSPAQELEAILRESVPGNVSATPSPTSNEPTN
jgi:hypothetical protein